MIKFLFSLIISFSLFINLFYIVPEAGINNLELIKPTGKFSIGTIRLSIIDENRQEIFSKEKNDKRNISLQIWYPSQIDNKQKTAEYMLPEIAEFMLSDKKDKDYRLPEKIGKSWQKFVNVHSKLNAKILAGNKFPILLYSPGLHSLCALGQNYIEEMASSGYIVVGIDSPYICGAALTNDGKIIFNDPNPSNMDYYSYLIKIYPEVVKDLNYVFNELIKTDGALINIKFKGKIDFNKAGVFGISFGGSAAIDLAINNPAIKAAANMDGSLWGNIKGFNKPVLFIVSGINNDNTIQNAWDKNSGPDMRVRINGALHENFGDIPYFLNYFFPEKNWTYPNVGTIDQVKCTHIVRTSLLSFFNKYLLNDTSKDVTALLKKYPEVEISVN